MFLENDKEKEVANINQVCMFNSSNNLQELYTKH